MGKGLRLYGGGLHFMGVRAAVSSADGEGADALENNYLPSK